MRHPHGRHAHHTNRWVEQVLEQLRQDPTVKRAYPGPAHAFSHRYVPGTRKTLAEYPGGRWECVYDERGTWMIHVVYHKTGAE